MVFRLTPQAEADIEGISLYIADDSPSAAIRWYDEILKRCRALGEMPGMGATREEVRARLRMFPVGSYLILYQEAEDGAAEIIRVVHGARQWQELL